MIIKDFENKNKKNNNKQDKDIKFYRKYLINGKEIKIYPKKFEGKLSLETYEKKIYRNLNKIGVSEKDVEIKYNDKFAEVNWIINNEKYCFRSFTQENATKNLGAISQAIEEDIRQVTRGIKDLFDVMKQYEEINLNYNKKKSLFDFNYNLDNKKREWKNKNKEDKINKIFSDIRKKKYKFLFLSKKQALRRKEEILEKYKNFSNISNIPEGKDKEELRQIDLYLSGIID